MTTITTNIEVPEQVLADIVTTAIEGGTGYWAGVTAYKWEDREPSDVYADIIDLEEGEADIETARVFRVDTRSVGAGLQLLADKYPHMFIPMAQNDWDHDSDDADVIVQLAMFGEVIYG